MRILLTSSASYAPPRGGATRSNLAWLAELVQEGHSVQVICSAWEMEGSTTQNGIAISSVKDLPLRTRALTQAIESFAPDVVLVSSEDLSHSLLREAARSAPGRLVYLAHTPQFFPFGPESWNPDPAAAAIVQQAAAVVVIGHHMAEYVREHAGRMATVIHPPIYGAPPYPAIHDGNGGAGVLMINPCAVKGLEIFLAAAERMPTLSFTGLAGWGTTAQDRERMQRLPNVRVLESVPTIDAVLNDAALLLMPSLWYEGFGLIAMEAMLRGLPVVASDSGGLKEAKGSTAFVIPVAPVTRYLPEFDEVHMPKPVVPVQDLEPWLRALQTLTTDSAVYREESARSRSYALSFVSALNPAALGTLLTGLPAASSPAADPKALLLKKLKQQRQSASGRPA